jgi:VWFA-related protein
VPKWAQLGQWGYPLVSISCKALCSALRRCTRQNAVFAAGSGSFGAVPERCPGLDSCAESARVHALPLLRFGGARKTKVLGADSRGVKGKIGWLFLTSFLMTVPAVAGESNFLVRKRVSEVQLTLVATDRNDRPLSHLSPTDILVLEEGQPIPRFQLRSAADLPLRIAIVLDLSDSTVKSWATIGTTLVDSLPQVMRSNDELLVLAFNSKIEMERTITDPVQLRAILAHPSTGGLTALYDALYHACGQAVFSDDHEPHRSALILFSDGEDDLSLHGLDDAIARAERRGISIYTVATHDPRKSTPGDTILHDLATTTSGKDYIVKNTGQLRDALSAINIELRNSYLLYYPVPKESSPRAFRRVRVIPTQSDGSRLRSRAGYFTAP